MNIYRNYAYSIPGLAKLTGIPGFGIPGLQSLPRRDRPSVNVQNQCCLAEVCGLRVQVLRCVRNFQCLFFFDYLVLILYICSF